MVLPILLALGGLIAAYILFRKDIDATVRNLIAPTALSPMPGQTTTTPPPPITIPTNPILNAPTLEDCGPITGPNFRCCACKTRACPGKQGCCEPCRAVCLADCTNAATMV